MILSIFLAPQISWGDGSKPLTADINDDIIRGIDLLYDWEFEQAENLFYKIKKQRNNKKEWINNVW